jgi:hypothetical protein
MSYMAQQNTRPAFFLHVYGWHTETTKTTKIKKQNGSTVSKHTETSTLQVTDWEYFIDLTPYIKPVGFIRAERNGESVPLCQCLKGFTECAKASKRLEMVKYIGEWNTKGLEKRITENLKETQGDENLVLGHSILHITANLVSSLRFCRTRSSTSRRDCVRRALCLTAAGSFSPPLVAAPVIAAGHGISSRSMAKVATTAYSRANSEWTWIRTPFLKQPSPRC